MIRALLALTACLTVGLAGTASGKVITPEFNAAEFSSESAHVTNRYFPLTPGTVMYYKGRKEGKAETDRFEVTHDTKTILGVNTVVIHDQVFTSGKLSENTLDWYAQDVHGNVWYFGEQTETLTRNGEQEGTEGSWIAGEPAEPGAPIAKPGIFMPGKAEPHVGFKQELAPPVSEDQFETLSLKTAVSTPYITTNRALRIKETTPLEKGVIDNKIYALGVGDVVEVTVKGPEDRLELVKVTEP
jgi:hypothetical protein